MNTHPKPDSLDIAQATSPIPVGVSSLTLFGMSVKDWIVVATAMLLIFQIIVITPKAVRVLQRGFTRLHAFIRGIIKHGK